MMRHAARPFLASSLVLLAVAPVVGKSTSVAAASDGAIASTGSPTDELDSGSKGIGPYSALRNHVIASGIDQVGIMLPTPAPLGAGGDPCAPQTNGCGPDGLFAELLNCPLDLVCFVDACNVHDYCYGVCGAPRTECDVLFYWLMLGICEDAFAPQSAEVDLCNDLAYIYFALVYLFGDLSYDSSQDRVCTCSPMPLEAPSHSAAGGWLPAPTFEDCDADLLPDDWEVAMGLDNTRIDTFDDPDADGLSNLAEFILGTDPLKEDAHTSPQSDTEKTADARAKPAISGTAQ